MVHVIKALYVGSTRINGRGLNELTDLKLLTAIQLLT